GLFAYEPHPPVAAKGKTAPLVAWRLLHVETAATDRGRAPLVGREDEIALLVGALEDALAGKGHIVSIVGEAGLGKTRLVDELLADPRALGARVARTQPVILALTDVQWADAASQELLAALAPALASTAALFVTTYRPDLNPPWSTSRGHLQIRLTPLASGPSAALLQALLPASA